MLLGWHGCQDVGLGQAGAVTTAPQGKSPPLNEAHTGTQGQEDAEECRWRRGAGECAMGSVLPCLSLGATDTEEGRLASKGWNPKMWVQLRAAVPSATWLCCPEVGVDKWQFGGGGFRNDSVMLLLVLQFITLINV